MSKKMDKYADILHRAKLLKQESSELGKRMREVDNERKLIASMIVAAMGKSTVGSLEDIDYFEVVDNGKETVTKERVMKYCPELADVLIVKNESLGLKFL
jgi:hypothetical protein